MYSIRSIMVIGFISEERNILRSLFAEIDIGTIWRFFLLTCVQEQMVFEIGDLAESPVTNGTSVRPGSIVNVHVGFQVARGGKRFLAQFAFVGLFLEIRNEHSVLKYHIKEKKGVGLNQSGVKTSDLL